MSDSTDSDLSAGLGNYHLKRLLAACYGRWVAWLAAEQAVAFDQDALALRFEARRRCTKGLHKLLERGRVSRRTGQMSRISDSMHMLLLMQKGLRAFTRLRASSFRPTTLRGKKPPSAAAIAVDAYRWHGLTAAFSILRLRAWHRSCLKGRLMELIRCSFLTWRSRRGSSLVDRWLPPRELNAYYARRCLGTLRLRIRVRASSALDAAAAMRAHQCRSLLRAMESFANLSSSNRRDRLLDKRGCSFWAITSERRSIGRLLAIKQSSAASEEILAWCRRYYLASACRRGTIRLIRNLKQRLLVNAVIARVHMHRSTIGRYRRLTEGFSLWRQLHHRTYIHIRSEHHAVVSLNRMLARLGWSGLASNSASRMISTKLLLRGEFHCYVSRSRWCLLRWMRSSWRTARQRFQAFRSLWFWKLWRNHAAIKRWVRFCIRQSNRRKALLRSSASYSKSQMKSACVEFAKAALSDARRCKLLNRRRVLRSVFRAWRWLTSCPVRGSGSHEIASVGSHNGTNHHRVQQNIVFPNALADKEAFSERRLSQPRLPVRNVYAVVDGRIVLNSGSECAVAAADDDAWGTPVAVASHYVSGSDVGTQQHSSKNDQKLQLVSDILHFIEEFKELLL